MSLAYLMVIGSPQNASVDAQFSFVRLKVVSKVFDDGVHAGELEEAVEEVVVVFVTHNQSSAVLQPES